jgi:UDP-N-acetylglucosamine acyltransferase
VIHPSAIIDSGAIVDPSAEVGPYSVIGADVEIGPGTSIGAHVVVKGPTRIGRDNRIHPFCSLGGDPQDKKFRDEYALLEIGDRNTIREYCTFNRGTEGGGGVTRIGSDNWIMAYVHVAHDCVVGNHITMANGATLAGHVVVEDFVTFGAFTVVHQFCSIGAHSFFAMGTVVFKDVPPYLMVAGNSASPHGLNSEGLRRRGFSPESVRGIKQAYRHLYRQGLGLEQAVEAIEAIEVPEAAHMAAFVRASSRGIVR